jgi:predicted metal-binding protein
MVRRNLKKTPKAAQPSKRTIQRRTLMSMRWAEKALLCHGFLLSAAFLAASPNQSLCQFCLKEGVRVPGGSLLEDPGACGLLALCLRVLSIMVTTISLRL